MERCDTKILVDAELDRLEKSANELGLEGYKPSGPVTLSDDTNPCYVLVMVREN